MDLSKSTVLSTRCHWALLKQSQLPSVNCFFTLKHTFFSLFHAEKYIMCMPNTVIRKCKLIFKVIDFTLSNICSLPFVSKTKKTHDRNKKINISLLTSSFKNHTQFIEIQKIKEIKKSKHSSKHFAKEPPSPPLHHLLTQCIAK